MPGITSELIVFDECSEPEGLKLVAKRYTTQSSNSDGLTLLFAHCIGSSKEQWEIVIEHLFRRQESTNRPRHLRIREAVSFDRQNHGDAAVFNKKLLEDRQAAVSSADWASAIASFVKSRLRNHRIVAIGHSAGASAMLLSTQGFPVDRQPYVALFLVEPVMVAEEVNLKYKEDRILQQEFIIKATCARRHSWPDREEAVRHLKRRIPWETWDARALRLYVDHCLRSVESPSGLPAVALKGDMKQQAMSFVVDNEPSERAVDELVRICRAVPIHLIFGDRIDVIPDIYQHSLDNASAGRVVASVTRVEDAGHMIVQEQPEALAEAIGKSLDRIPEPAQPAKL